MAEIDIMTIEEVQSLLLDSSAESQTALAFAITRISAAFNQIAGYQLVTKEYEDQVVNGTGETLLVFPAMNVTACSKLEYRSSKTEWTELEDDHWELDYVHKLGVVGYSNFRFTRGLQNWRATFTAGWSQVNMPGLIIEAFITEIQRWTERRWDLSSKSHGGQANSTTGYRDISAHTRQMLMAYCRIGI